MKGKCGDCPAYQSNWCRVLQAEVKYRWTGCRIDAETWVRHHPKGKEDILRGLRRAEG